VIFNPACILAAMSNDPRTTPSKIYQSGPTELAIKWGDDVTSLFPVRGLRLSCTCAECVDEWTGEAQLSPDSVPADVHPVRTESVGNYAIQIDWSDGHSTGIYSYVRLRELADRQNAKQ
jgi:ATP-binding protein involved in chromosome partitioning